MDAFAWEVVGSVAGVVAAVAAVVFGFIPFLRGNKQVPDLRHISSQTPFVTPAPPASQPRVQFTQQRSWQLAVAVDAGSKKTFRLSSGSEEHEIAVTLARRADIIEVDGSVIVREYDIDGKEFPLKTLSSTVGADVTIKVEVGAYAYRIRWLILKIGEQVLMYDSKFR